MATIDIKKSYRHISPEELRSAAYSGIVYCGSYDLSDLLEYIFQDFYTQQDIDKLVKEAVEEDRDSYSRVESLKQNIREAIEILEDSL